MNFVGTQSAPLDPEDGARLLAARTPNPDMAPDPDLPEDTRLWAALQTVSGGPWAGAVYDPEKILIALGLEREPESRDERRCVNDGSAQPD